MEVDKASEAARLVAINLITTMKGKPDPARWYERDPVYLQATHASPPLLEVLVLLLYDRLQGTAVTRASFEGTPLGTAPESAD